MLPGKSRTLRMTTYIWEFLLRFFRKDVGRIFQVVIKFFQINQKNLVCFKWRHLSENFCTYFLGRTSAGKNSIFCLRPSVENDLILIWRTSAGWVKVSLALPPPPGLHQCVDPLPSWLGRRVGGGGQKKSCFDFAENQAAVSLWVGAHRYQRDSSASKLLWV